MHGALTPERFRRIEEVFDAVADAADDERAGLLVRLAGDDHALRREVESLLAAWTGSAPRLDAAIAREVALVADSQRHIDGRYQLLEKLGEGGMGVVYSARDRLTGQHVAIKRVHLKAVTSPTRSSTTALLALAREFRTLATIRHPYVISVLDYGFGADREPYFTMELLAGARSLLAATEGESVLLKVRLLVQVLAALTYVHRRGVLHRDLKPANVLVVGDGEAARVVVLDFGIACVRDPSDPAALAGTIGYMAPELFAGATPGEAGDLWAVAVIACELLLGRRPFADRGTLERPPTSDAELPSFESDEGLSPALAAVLRRALRVAPADRHADAATFARELANAVGLAPPVESAEIRESFLSAAAFVAREAELATLQAALERAIDGAGSIVLVGGESGVGKSRLLDELRSFALVRGVRVTRGQAVDVGGAAYQIWRGALRPLCLDTGLDDADAGVLRVAIPDIAALLGRPIPDPPEVEPQPAELRFIAAAERLLRRVRAPLVLLLEDLHWSDTASLRVLQRLSAEAAQRPLLVVASFRDDERPGLPGELPAARLLPLRRLTTDAIAELGRSMLGPAGGDPGLVALLARETEGNALFVVEVVRALAEEVGALARVGADGRLPEQVTAGGIEAVLRRRVARVPAPAWPLLTAAAVFGRELDVRVLAALDGELGERLAADLAACTATGVLEVHQDGLRFSHHRLRGELLAGLPTAERIAWHRRVAAAIERAHAGDLAAHAAMLAHHYEQADEPRREAEHRVTAGERASRGGAVDAAIIHLERAGVLFDRAGVPALAQARTLYELIRAYNGAERYDEAFVVLRRMYAELGYPQPRSPLGLLGNIVRRLGQHALARVRPAAPRTTPAYPEIGAASLTLNGRIAIFQSPAQMLSSLLDSVVLAERSGEPALLVASCGGMRMLTAVSLFAGLSDGYRRRAQRAAEALPDTRLDVRAYVEMIESAVHIHRGEWAPAQARIATELALRRRMGDWPAELFALLQGHFAALYRGDLASALDLLRRIDALAVRDGSGQMRWNAEHLYGQLALRRGALDEAARLFAEAEARMVGTPLRDLRVLLGGPAALCELRRGDREAALPRADAALDRLADTPPMQYSLLEYLSAVLEVHMDLWSTAEERSALAARITRGLAVLRKFAIVMPIVRPRALLWHGRWAAARGHRRLAALLLGRALAAAERLRMPFDEALVRASLASLTADPPRAAEQARRAAALFERVDAGWYAAAVTSDHR